MTVSYVKKTKEEWIVFYRWYQIKAYYINP